MGLAVSLWNLEVYPKVKVRQQEDQDDQHVVRDLVSPVNKLQDGSPPTVAKIPKSYVPSVVIPSISVAEGAKENKIEERNKQNIRASSIPRPRAVLSSPDNDMVIGNKNKIKAQRPSAPKNYSSVQNKHTQSAPRHITENDLKAKKSKEALDENSLRERKGSAMTVPSQRRPLRTGKPSWVGT